MKKPVYYRFKIDAYSPETIPMSRLAEYLSDLAHLLGHEDNVHLQRVEKGSVVPVVAVEYTAAPKVRERLKSVQRGDAELEAIKAYDSIDRRLAQDNAVGILSESQKLGEIIKFPGRERPEKKVFSPFNQQGVLDGQLIKVGGELEVVPVHLQFEDRTYICSAKRSVAKRIAPHIFGAPLRVRGTGRWERDDTGEWRLLNFRIDTFDVLDDSPLIDVVEKMRAIKGSLAKIEDPLGELDAIRHGDENVN